MTRVDAQSDDRSPCGRAESALLDRVERCERRLDGTERSIRRQRALAFAAGVGCTLALGASSATLIDRVVVEPGPRPLVVTIEQAKDASLRIQLVDDKGAVIGAEGRLPFED